MESSVVDNRLAERINLADGRVCLGSHTSILEWDFILRDWLTARFKSGTYTCRQASQLKTANHARCHPSAPTNTAPLVIPPRARAVCLALKRLYIPSPSPEKESWSQVPKPLPT